MQLVHRRWHAVGPLLACILHAHPSLVSLNAHEHTQSWTTQSPLQIITKLWVEAVLTMPMYGSRVATIMQQIIECVRALGPHCRKA